jgi:hypothetical protein
VGLSTLSAPSAPRPTPTADAHDTLGRRRRRRYGPGRWRPWTHAGSAANADDTDNANDTDDSARHARTATYFSLSPIIHFYQIMSYRITVIVIVHMLFKLWIRLKWICNCQKVHADCFPSTKLIFLFQWWHKYIHIKQKIISLFSFLFYHEKLSFWRFAGHIFSVFFFSFHCIALHYISYHCPLIKSNITINVLFDCHSKIVIESWTIKFEIESITFFWSFQTQFHLQTRITIDMIFGVLNMNVD